MASRTLACLCPFRPAKARPDLVVSNLSNTGFPYESLSVASGHTKRWELPIPVKHKNDPRLLKAMRRIEWRLGRPIFDRDSLVEVPDNQIQAGIIFSNGTALGPNGPEKKYVGHVSDCPSRPNYPPAFVQSNGTIKARFYLNLDNTEGGRAKVAHVIHELGHAMGLGRHFPGFGEGNKIIGCRFWNALRLLYSHPPGTAEKDL